MTSPTTPELPPPARYGSIRVGERGPDYWSAAQMHAMYLQGWHTRGEADAKACEGCAAAIRSVGDPEK